jgi:hypothetical protein
MRSPARLLTATLLVAAVLAGLVLPMQAPPARAAVVPLLCTGADWNGLHNPPNTWSEVLAGRLRLPGGSAADVTPGGGSVRWGMDPFRSVGWRKWLLSLKWTGSLVIRASGRSDIISGRPVPPTAQQRRQAIDAAVQYVRDYVANVPLGRYGSVEAANGHHRVHAMACVLDAWRRVYADLGLPAPSTGWFQAAIAQQAAKLQVAYRGSWNQGLDDAQAVMLAGCVARDQDLLGWATKRLAELSRSTMDDEGITTEQSVGYTQYLWSRWKLVEAKAESCDLTLPSGLLSRLDRVAQFVVLATRPDGKFAQIGDTYASPSNYAPQPLTSAGLPLTRAYANGWAFVRSGWTRSDSLLTMRYGPGRTYHGHFDHTSMTYFARGHEVLADSGHVGYESRARRDYIWSPEAHSVVSARADWIRRPDTTSKATLRSFVPTPLGAKLRVTDYGYPSISRDRSVELRQDLNALLTVDRVRALRSGSVGYTQRWVLPPGWSVTKKARTVFVASRGSERITVVRVPVGAQASLTGRGQPFGPTGAAVVSGYVGVDPGVVRSNQHVVFRQTASATVFVTVVVAHHSATPVSVKADPSAGSRCVRVVVGSKAASMCG